MENRNAVFFFHIESYLNKYNYLFDKKKNYSVRSHRFYSKNAFVVIAFYFYKLTRFIFLQLYGSLSIISLIKQTTQYDHTGYTVKMLLW